MPTLPWRRRTSTPFFPGAWPNSSTSDHSDDQRLPVYNNDAPPQLPELRHLSSRKDNPNHGGRGQEDPAALAEEGWGFPVVSEQHGFEDNGRLVGARDRRHGSQPASMSSPASTNAPLSATLSQASTFSDPTDSEGVLTPESVQGPLWPPPHADTAESIKDNLYSSSGSLYHSFDDHVHHEHASFPHDATIDTINVDTTISSFNTANICSRRSATRAAYRNPPLLDFSKPLPHSRISLDWEAVASSPKGKDALSQSPSPPQSLIEFSIPSMVASPALGDAAASVCSSEAMATSFFPIPSTNSHEQSSDAQQVLSQPLSSPSAYSLGTDSPVLPNEVNPAENAKPPSHSPYILMATDLDAFAAAAASTDSSLSLPTSLHSAASDALLAETQASDPSLVWPLHLRSFSNNSAEQDPSLVVTPHESNTKEFPTTPGAVDDCDEYDKPSDAALEEAIQMRARRMSAPLLQSPHTHIHHIAQRERTQTLSGRVEAQRAKHYVANSAPRTGKLPVLGKMRKLGGRLLSLFGGKNTKASSSAADSNVSVPAEFAVEKMHRRRAVTQVDFESHPIPAPETPARDARASRRSLPLRVPKSPSGTSRSPQCESFLPIEDPGSSSKGILSIPFQHMRGSPSIQLNKEREPSTSTHSSPTRASRSRTLTAPANPLPSITGEKDSNGKQARRFSLSSALSRSHLDALKAAVVPRPPLPDFPQSPTCDQHPHRDEAVRPVRMIPPTGLNAKSSQTSLRGVVGGLKKGKERARPVSMFVQSSSLKRPFLDHPQIQIQAPTPMIGMAPSTIEDKRTRHASMLVGKEKEARRGMTEVSGPRWHHPSQSTDESENGKASASDGKTGPRLAVSSQLVDEASTDMSHNEIVQGGVPIERRSSAVLLTQADPVQAESSQASRRRFSLSSTISQRAIRARSMIVSVGRRSCEGDRGVDCAANNSGSTDATATPSTSSSGTASPRPTHRRDRGSTFSTIIDAGVHFDMLTPAFGFAIPTPASSPRAASDSPATSSQMSTDIDFPRSDNTGIPRPRHGSLDVDASSIQEMEEYTTLARDSDLDSMSFAGTATLMESIASSMISIDSSYADSFFDAHEQPTESSVSLGTPQDLVLLGERIPGRLGEPFEGAEPVKRVELARALSSAVKSSDSSEGETPVMETIEREEERGFLRALGLEMSMEQSSACGPVSS